MRCILCGGAVGGDYEIDTNPLTNGGSPMKLKGFKCDKCGESWSIQDHKDNQDWNVRHTRALEQRVQTLEQQLKELLELMKR